MASLAGFSTGFMGADSVVVNIHGDFVESYQIGVESNYRGLASTTFADYTDRKDSRKGYTPVSSVYVLDIMQIKGPRVFPLEIAWKNAATS